MKNILSLSALFSMGVFSSAYALVDQLTVTTDLFLPNTINVGTQIAHLATTLDFPNGLNRTFNGNIVIHDGGRVNLNGGSLGDGSGSTGFITVRSGGRFFLDDSGVVNRPFNFTVDGGQFVMEFGTFSRTLRVQEDSLADGNPSRGVATIFDGNFIGQILAAGGTFVDIAGGVFTPSPFTFSLESLGANNNTINIAGSNIVQHTNFLSFDRPSDLFIFQGADFMLNGNPVTLGDVVPEEGVFFVQGRSTSGNPLVLSGTLLDNTAFSFELPRLSDSEAQFAISAIPEPTTYAAFISLLGLGLLYWRRK